MKRLATVGAVVLTVLLAVPGTALAQPPTNDDFDNATEIQAQRIVDYTNTVNTEQATREPNEPSCFDVEQTVWYRITPTETGGYNVDVSGSTFAPTVAIFAVTPDGLDVAACGDSWGATAGTTYYIQVGNAPGTPGGQLSFRLRSSLTADLTINPRGRVDPRTGIATITGTATCGTSFLWLDGEVRQRVRRFTISSNLYPSDPSCHGVPQPWAGEAQSQDGWFGPGQATVRLFAEICPSSEYCFYGRAEETIRLTL